MKTFSILLLSSVSYLCIGCSSTPCVTVGEEYATEARRQLLEPARHDIHLSGVDAPTAVQAIKNLFGWTPSPEMNWEEHAASLTDVRITIDRDCASLAEVLADLCNQSGFHEDEDFGNYNNYGSFDSIRYEETGERNLAFSKDGLLLLLRVYKLNDMSDTFGIYPNLVDAIPWTFYEKPRLKINEFVYPDGTRLDILGEELPLDENPLEPLVANQGQIKTIHGVLSVQLPLKVAVHEISLSLEDIPKERYYARHFVRITKLDKIQNGWLLACKYGNWSAGRWKKRIPPSLDKTYTPPAACYVEVLDPNSRPMEGSIKRFGGGSGPPDGQPSSTNENFQTFEREYLSKPSAVRLIYVINAEEYRIPVYFTDCRVPDSVWNPQHKKDEVQPITTAVGGE